MWWEVGSLVLSSKCPLSEARLITLSMPNLNNGELSSYRGITWHEGGGAVHSKLRSITPVAIKVHVILRSFVVLTWVHDTIELV